MDKLEIFKQLNLLYVEDDHISGGIFKELFEEFFQKVYFVSNGLEALEIYNDKTVHVVITDIKMPKMDGLEMISNIRKKDKHLPIFITSSYSEKEQLLKAITLNLSNYIIKPLSKEKIIEALHSCTDVFQSDDVTFVLNSQNFTYSSDSRVLSSGEMKVRLQNKEALLLELFLKHKTQIVTKEMIGYELYADEVYSEGTIKNLISKLRKKLGNESIKTVKYSGYVLV